MNNLLMPAGPAQGAPMMPQGGPQGDPGAMQGGPQGPMPPAPDPAAIADARNHMGVMVKGLLGLASQPRGSLTKRSVFDAMGEMIAQGAFSTPQAKQQLVAEMAQMPDDETAIRQTIGQHLLRLNEMAEQFTHHFGAEG